MTAPDSLKLIINELLDKHWEDLLREEEFSEIIYNESYPITTKISFSKDADSRYTIKIVPKWGM